ncbi:hypothetical protein XBKB1_2040003 [Xenorhabdus bovienii str. kraussei Becker Underwood]|uniref:Uncharacterized protein n=1 Tax=Xenorhabdus bovienii str. kraussei Becker Underwood TaxID=1398204 RepID=A0A077PSQ7_XENBV|nr:hypothetical protein XBKB1_2040003 [Xenorhabdus bovienii str. kraussei Becker Underwood]
MLVADNALPLNIALVESQLWRCCCRPVMTCIPLRRRVRATGDTRQVSVSFSDVGVYGVLGLLNPITAGFYC